MTGYFVALETHSGKTPQGIGDRERVLARIGGAKSPFEASLKFPTQLQGQHGREDMAPGTALLADIDGPHLQQTGLQVAKIALDLLKVTVIPNATKIIYYTV